MPFHNYSDVALRAKGKDFLPYRHSSPAVYDCTKDSKSPHPGGGVNIEKDVHANNGVVKKNSRMPFRSNSNPAYFEDYSTGKAKERSKKLSSKEENGGVLITGKEVSIFLERKTDAQSKTSPVIPRRHSSFNGSVIQTQNGTKPPTNSPVSTPKIIINKPPVPINAPGSPLASVKLRSKPAGSPKGSRKRQGFILDAQTTISSPVLISHEISTSGESGVKLRELDEQEELMNKLKIRPPTASTKRAEKPPIPTQPEPANSVGTRMAERIQRTIKALYTNSPTKKSYAIRENLLPLDDDSDGNMSPETKVKMQHTHLESSPKSDKRNNRKRSPKPSQKNTLQAKDVDGSRRFKWRGSVNKIVKKFGTGQPFILNGTFGVHLEDCPPSAINEFVPFIVELCCRIVEERGLHFTGIYRVPGNNAALSALQDDLNNHGVESINADDERLKDLNVVSSLLKSFFRKLPEPMFTNELYHDFILANRSSTPESRLNSLRKLVHMLPGPHYETLKFLISHLRLVADNCESNKMEVRNLAIVFGPTLVCNTAADNATTMVTDMSDQCRIIESIIDHCDFFFHGEHEEIPAFVRTFHL